MTSAALKQNGSDPVSRDRPPSAAATDVQYAVDPLILFRPPAAATTRARTLSAILGPCLRS